MAIRTLAHHIDVEFLRVAYQQTRKDGATGVDHQTAADYAVNLEGNLESLHERFKSGAYFAPPVRRIEIPKPDGTKRPLGIPTFEDKVLQRAVTMVLTVGSHESVTRLGPSFRPPKKRSPGSGRPVSGVETAPFGKSSSMRAVSKPCGERADGRERTIRRSRVAARSPQGVTGHRPLRVAALGRKPAPR